MKVTLWLQAAIIALNRLYDFKCLCRCKTACTQRGWFQLTVVRKFTLKAMKWSQTDFLSMLFRKKHNIFTLSTCVLLCVHKLNIYRDAKQICTCSWWRRQRKLNKIKALHTARKLANIHTLKRFSQIFSLTITFSISVYSLFKQTGKWCRFSKTTHIYTHINHINIVFKQQHSIKIL